MDISNKERVLKVRDIFFEETDEENKLSYVGLIQRLKKEYGDDYEIGIRAIRDDIKVMKEYYPALEEDIDDNTGRKYFCLQERLFYINELRTLIDSISTASSIDLEQKNILINKLKRLTNRQNADKLSNQIHVDSKVVTQDNKFSRRLETIHYAMQENNNLEFEYGRYNLKKEFAMNSWTYRVSPYGLVWNNGFYYLVAYNKELKKVINYRVDRIRNVNILNEKYNSKDFDLAEHLNSCFNMYPGKVMRLVIKFHGHLINAIIDRFGKDVNIELVDDEHFILHVDAAISTGLMRWVLNWGSDAEVISPPELIDMINRELGKMSEIYNNKKGD